MCKVNNAATVKVILPVRRPEGWGDPEAIRINIVVTSLSLLWVDAKIEVDT
jgi:hypothetical protein